MLVALVANGLTTALIVLAIIIAVQQIEGNVLQPVLQSKSMKLHAVDRAARGHRGRSLFGIVGASSPCPVAAVGAVVIRYLGEQIDHHLERATPLRDAVGRTADGTVAARRRSRRRRTPSAPTAARDQRSPGGRHGARRQPAIISTVDPVRPASRAAGSGSAAASRRRG